MYFYLIYIISGMLIVYKLVMNFVCLEIKLKLEIGFYYMCGKELKVVGL